MTVDVSKLREGDVLLVRAIVRPENGTGLRAQVSGLFPLVRELDIVSVEPRPLKVGDEVFRGGERRWTIAAIEGDAALIRDRGGISSAYLSDLSPA